MFDTPATNQGLSKESGSSNPNAQSPPGTTKSQEDSKTKQEKKRSLQDACLCMDKLRREREIRVATTWLELWNNLNSDCRGSLQGNLTVDKNSIREISKTEDRLAKLRQDLESGGQCARIGLTEGEAAAVLVYTAGGKSQGNGLYALVNNTLRDGQLEQVSVFVATLVSALRKLRKHSQPVACACHWTDYPPLDKEQFFITRGFLSTTRCLGERPGTLDGKNSVYVIPHKRQVAVLPECLSFNPEEEEAIFEPGTAFRRVAMEVFEELPPADVVPTITPILLHNASGGMLVPAQQTQLLFPVGTHFIPCERPTGDPPAAGAADATQT